MLRNFCLGGLFLAVVCSSAIGIGAQTPKPDSKMMLRRLAARLPKAKLQQGSSGPRAQSHRARSLTVGLEITESVFVDTDGSGDDLTFGDRFHLFGAILSGSGRELGSWEADLTLTTDASPLGLTHMTLRFIDSGTVVVSGSPYPDGVRLRDAVGARVPVAPIVGTTGTLGYLRDGVGFAWDDDTELLIAAIGVR